MSPSFCSLYRLRNLCRSIVTVRCTIIRNSGGFLSVFIFFPWVDDLRLLRVFLFTRQDLIFDVLDFFSLSFKLLASLKMVSKHQSMAHVMLEIYYGHLKWQETKITLGVGTCLLVSHLCCYPTGITEVGDNISFTVE